MSQTATRARLGLSRLDDRLVPSTVTAVTTARPFDFVADGTLTMTEPTADGVATSTSTVHLAGSLAYTSPTAGESGMVTVSGEGTGTGAPADSAETGGRGTFAHTVQGQLSFADDDGTVSTTAPLTGTMNWLTPRGGAGIDLIGPHAAAGMFDVSTFRLAAGWDAAGATGTLAVTLANAADAATDLAFDQKFAAGSETGGVNLDFSVLVSGNLMTAPARDTPVAQVTAVWQGNGQTEAADIDVPVFWNTGRVTVNAADLTPPEWAETLTVRIDAAGVVGEGDEGNNAWTVALADLGSATLPPTAPTPGGFPRIPSDPERVTASYTLIQGEVTQLQWRDQEGVVLAATEAFETFGGPVGIATGDVNADGVLDVALAAGVGGGPRVRVLDGKTGVELLNTFAYDAEFRGGVNVALADVDGDGKADLVTGAGAGGGPHVRVFDVSTGALTREFFAGNPEGQGGARVAAADLDGDSRAEIITTAGPGGGGFLFVHDGDGRERYATLVAPPDYAGGVKVAAVPESGQDDVLVIATPEDTGPVTRFRSQLAAGGPILVSLPSNPVAVDPPLFVA